MTLNDIFEELKGELHDARCKVDEMESSVQNHAKQIEFLYRPQRYKVLQKKRALEDGIWVTEDLIWEDREAKKKLKEVMKEAFENGKKPRLSRGKLYIDGALYCKT